MKSLVLEDKNVGKITTVEMKYMRQIVGKTKRYAARNKRYEVGQKKTFVSFLEERQMK